LFALYMLFLISARHLYNWAEMKRRTHDRVKSTLIADLYCNKHPTSVFQQVARICIKALSQTHTKMEKRGDNSENGICMWVMFNFVSVHSRQNVCGCV